MDFLNSTKYSNAACGVSYLQTLAGALQCLKFPRWSLQTVAVGKIYKDSPAISPALAEATRTGEVQ